MLKRLDAVEEEELTDLIRRSYEMVSARAPGKSNEKRVPARAPRAAKRPERKPRK